MYCRKCGTPNDDNAFRCIRCGDVVQTIAGQPAGGGFSGHPDVASMPPVPTRLAESICVTLFCCLPCGIVGIVNASSVAGKLAAGDYAGAVEASNRAKNWNIAGFIGGIVVAAIYFAAGMGGARF